MKWNILKIYLFTLSQAFSRALILSWNLSFPETFYSQAFSSGGCLSCEELVPIGRGLLNSERSEREQKSLGQGMLACLWQTALPDHRRKKKRIILETEPRNLGRFMSLHSKNYNQPLVYVTLKTKTAVIWNLIILEVFTNFRFFVTTCINHN